MRTRPALSPALASVAALVSLAPCATANRAAAAGEPASGAHEGVLTLTSRAPTDQHGRWFVEFQEEINQLPGSAGIVVGSLRGAADVDCGASQFKVAKFNLFSGSNLTGAVLLDVGESADWRSAKPGTTMDRVLAAACGKTKGLARTAGARPPDPVAPPAKPSAASAPATSAPPASGRLPAPAAAPADRAFYAQLAALSSADAARQAWAALKRSAPGVLDDRLRRLTTTTVHGRRVYRVLAGGFGTKAEAETVCKALARLTARCFVRPRDLG